MRTLLMLMLAVSFTACVPPARFKALQSESLTCSEERDMLKATLEKLSVEQRETAARLASAEQKLARAGKDTLKLREEVNRLTRQHELLKNDYSDLHEAQQALAQGSETEIRRLMSELIAARKDLQQRENELEKLSADLTTRKTDLDRVQQELETRNARLSELEQALNQQQQTLSSLRKKVSDALLGFENQGLTITQKNGKVYVSLEEKLLFKSGSATVDSKGVSALKNLARVLEQNPDINVTIEGHTDDVQVLAGSAYKDNWDLSVLRATSIVRILLEGSSINPQRLTTAGRSQYQPVDPGKTPEARQKNRRTEIILSPRLDTLYELIQE
ncbi:MAG: OmpA family protein [Bacteroidales bacterium]|nr:OmpA family protein [Bacteroidales bacterium]